MNDRQLAALTEPLNGDDPAALARRRHLHLAGDGILVTTILAVDR